MFAKEIVLVVRGENLSILYKAHAYQSKHYAVYMFYAANTVLINLLPQYI